MTSALNKSTMAESEAVMEWGMTVVRRQLCCNHVSNKQEGLDVQAKKKNLTSLPRNTHLVSSNFRIMLCILISGSDLPAPLPPSLSRLSTC
jgi:hypothetical protein